MYAKFYIYYLIIISSIVVAPGFLSRTRSIKQPCGGYNLDKCLQPNDVGRNLAYDYGTTDEDGVLCARDCTAFSEPRTCYYKFVVEQYHAMGPACDNCAQNHTACFNPQCVIGDGIERTVLVINRLLPGPALHVCYGDRIIIDVHNKMPARELTIHWHGILQEQTPFMDGVAYVTQCPINEGLKFRYDFRANTKGSRFYHSHVGFQMMDGLSGVLIVRESRKLDPVSVFYDYDLFSHTVHLTDWMHILADDKYPGFNKNESMITLKSDSYLINGMGSYTNPVSHESTGTPWATFKIRAGFRYRFRILGVSSLDCSMKITFEGHSMLLIATDGYPVEPVIVRTLYMTSGDTYDVVITANQKPGAYWIRVQGTQDCEPAIQQGILQYEESDQEIPVTQNTVGLFTALPFPDLQNIVADCSRPDNLCLDEINSVYEAPKRLLRAKIRNPRIYHLSAHLFTKQELYRSNTYHQHYLPIAGPNVKELGGMVIDTINNKTNVFPPFILSMSPRIPPELLCPKKCDFCECLNLEYIKKNKVIEIIIFDDMSTDTFKVSHPMHMHGSQFGVFKVGSANERKTYDFNQSPVSNTKPVIKDSIAVPAGGFVILRFEANNPGIWPFHCHITFHHHNGMLVLYHVGKREDFKQFPEKWPVCGDYLPFVDTTNY